jgi:anti-anti-sigma factor
MSVVQEPFSSRLRVLHIEGPLRVPLDLELRYRVRALLRRGERQILLNLAGVPSIDAGGVSELVRVYNMTTAANGVLRIADPTARVRRILEVVGLFDLVSADSD